jgi:hypothetical protein
VYIIDIDDAFVLAYDKGIEKPTLILVIFVKKLIQNKGPRGRKKILLY